MDSCKMVWFWIVFLGFILTSTVTGNGEEWNKTDIIMRPNGEKVVMKFKFSELRDYYNKYIFERDGKRNSENEITIQDLMKNADIRYKKRMDSSWQQIIFEDQTKHSVSSQTDIFLTEDFFVVIIRKLQKEDAGIYWVQFNSIPLGWTALIITGKPMIKGLAPPYPVLKPEDNYRSTLQLECQGTSTCTGDCQMVDNQMYIIWYQNGMRMTDVGSTSSKINVIVDHYGGNFTCLATDYLPCYHRLRTTKHFDDVFNIDECNKVSESEKFILKPKSAPIDVQLEKNKEEMKVRSSSECDLVWNLENEELQTDLLKLKISIPNKGMLICLEGYSHREVMKYTTETAKENDNEKLGLVQQDMMVAEVIVILVGSTMVVVILVVIVAMVMVKKYQNRKGEENKVPLV